MTPRTPPEGNCHVFEEEIWKTILFTYNFAQKDNKNNWNVHQNNWIWTKSLHSSAAAVVTLRENRRLTSMLENLHFHWKLIARLNFVGNSKFAKETEISQDVAPRFVNQEIYWIECEMLLLREGVKNSSFFQNYVVNKGGGGGEGSASWMSKFCLEKPWKFGGSQRSWGSWGYWRSQRSGTPKRSGGSSIFWRSWWFWSLSRSWRFWKIQSSWRKLTLLSADWEISNPLKIICWAGEKLDFLKVSKAALILLI